MLLHFNDLILQLLHLLLDCFRGVRLGKIAQLLLIVDIGKSLTLRENIFLPILKIISRALILPILTPQARLIVLKLFGVAQIPLLLILD